MFEGKQPRGGEKGEKDGGSGGHDAMASASAQQGQSSDVRQALGKDDADEAFDLTGFKVFVDSQFKLLYDLGNGDIISVRKDGSAKMTQDEVDAFAKIGAAGLPTPSPVFVECLENGKKVPGIRMKKVEGTFIDFAKVDNDTILFRAIALTLQGQKVDTSEMGIMALMRAKVGDKTDAQAKAVLKSELENILKQSKKVVVNDLQAIVGKDGKLTIIDPTWAGEFSEIKGMEAKFVMDTYGRVNKILGAVTRL